MMVVDTSVVSYLFRGDGRATYYRELIHGRRAVISFQTVEEMRYGAYVRNWGTRRMGELDRYLDQFETIWANPELADICARLRNERKSAGRKMQKADAWIAATAIMLRCPLASHDYGFAGIPGLELVQAPRSG